MDTIKTWLGGLFMLGLIVKAFSCACDSTEPTKEAIDVKDKFKFSQCSCWKVAMPLAGIHNALEKDSGYELGCKAVAKNTSKNTYSRIRITFAFLTAKGYNYDSFSLWSDVDNFKPGSIVRFQTLKGMEAPPYSSQFRSTHCEVINVEK